MASNQIGKERELRKPNVDMASGDTGQMGGGFGSSGERRIYVHKPTTGDVNVAGQQPCLEEIGKYRAAAQQQSVEALRAAENRYSKAKQSESQQRPGQDVTVLGNEEEVETGEGYGLTSTLTTAAQKTKDTVLTAAEKARNVAVPAVKTAAEYTSKAGWGTAHLTASAAVEGTKMASNTIQGVAGYVAPTVANVAHRGAEMAANTFNAAANAAVSTGESARDYAARKKEEAGGRDFVTGKGVVDEDQSVGVGEDKRTVDKSKTTYYKYE